MEKSFEKVLEIMRLLSAVMSSYFGDVTTSIWYKQYQIEIQIYRLFKGKVGMKIIVRKDNISCYIAEQDNAGAWENNTWALCPSKVANTLEEAIKTCK